MGQRAMSMERALRNSAIIVAYAAGATLAQIGAEHGLSASGVFRILVRNDARPTHADRRTRRLRDGRRTGPRGYWPDCPPHLAAEYRRLRKIIGPVSARDQLIALDARERAARSTPPGSRP
jgi:hypothetical protein